jgi:hypothetical protein
MSMQRTNSEAYQERILEIIKRTRATPFADSTDYLASIRDLYVKLTWRKKKVFRGSLVDLLDKRDCLEDVVEVCRAIGVREACPKLVKLFEQPPQRVDGYRVWVEGFRRTVLHALGDLACDQALPLLRRLMKVASSKKRSRRRYLEREGYGVAIQTLAQLSPDEVTPYFGWWVHQVPKIDRRTAALAKGTEDWAIMERMGIAPNLGFGSRSDNYSIQLCIKVVLERRGVEGLRGWLKKVCLFTEQDREFLQDQLAALFGKKNPLLALPSTLGLKKDIPSFASELSMLPSVKQRKH